MLPGCTLRETRPKEAIGYNPYMLRFSTAGESHGEALVAILSGLPAGVAVQQAFVDHDLWRRQQGYGRGGRMRLERDAARFLSGVRHGKTIGRLSRSCSKTVIGRTGRRRCRLSPEIRKNTGGWKRRDRVMPIWRVL